MIVNGERFTEADALAITDELAGRDQRAARPARCPKQVDNP
ncbi:hypothetical protein [Mycobacterium sp. MUNTM1]